MFYKYAVYAITLSLLFSGCSSSKQDLLSTPLKSNIKPISTSKYVSKSGYYFVLVEKNNNIWKIVDIKDTPIENRAKANQEILRVNESYSEIHPYFEKTNINYNLSKYTCNNFNSIDNYTPCTSTLSTIFPDKNIFSFINFKSAAPKYKFIDEKLIDKAVKETNLLSAIESNKNIFEYEESEHSFRQAKTIEDFNAFIEKYSYLKDAHQLITLAIQNRDAMIEKKNIEEEKKRKEEERLAKANEQRTQIREKQLEKETSELEKMEHRAMQNFTKNVEKFRKTLKSGVETNCGQIIETKGSSVKVHFSVKNHGDEHWIDSNKIFPKGHGCRFVNGNYIAPATF